jgi:hypothetical protein
MSTGKRILSGTSGNSRADATKGFWRTCSDIGAKLAQVALEQPELFQTPVSESVAA